MAKKIKLTNKNDTFDAGGGNDYVLGLNGNDKIDGGTGNDTLVGGKGNDKLTSNAGNDTLDGGKGNDTAIIGGNFTDATITKNGKVFTIEIDGRTITAKNIETFKFDDRTLTADQMDNDAPTGAATAVLADGAEDSAYIVSAADLLQGFSDADSDTLSISDLAASNGATVVDNGDGTYTVTPAANFNGTVTLSYNVADGRGGTVAGTNTVNIAAVNDAPTGAATAVLADGVEDTGYVVSAASLLEGFSDIDGDTLSISDLAASDGATVVDNGDGTYTITPAADDDGPVTLSYNVVDGNGGSTAASNTVNFTAVNDAPAGTPSAVLPNGTEDSVYVVTAAQLLQGMSDVDGDTLTIANLVASDGATVVDNGNGTYSITPAANDTGLVTFNYDVLDGNGGTTAVSNSVTFNAVNDAPTGASTADLIDGTEDTAYVVSAADLLAGFSDVEGDTLSVANLVASDGATVVDNGDGTYTITPALDYTGTIDLDYDVIDGNGGSVAASTDFDVVASKALTAGTDSITNLTSGDDTVTGAAGTLNIGDLIVDNFSNDADELNVTLTAINGAATISGIEEINVNWDSFATAAFDATNVKGADIELSSSKVGFLGAATITAAGNNTITAGSGMVGALTVNGVTASTINATNSSSVVAAGSGAATDSATINVGASATSISSSAIETVTATAGAATTSVSVTGYNTATIDAGTATAITLTDDAATDVATVTVGADATVTNTGSLGKLTLNVADGKAVTINAIGADLTVASTGSVTINSTGFDGETVVDNVAGTLTLVSTTDNDVSFTKADADLFVLSTGSQKATFVSGDKSRVDVDLAGGTLVADGAGTTDTLTTTFTKSQTGTTLFSGAETVNIVAAAAAVVGTDLTINALTVTPTSGTAAVNLTGTNDVAIGTLTASAIDASGLVGDLTITTVDASATSVIGSTTGTNTVTFAANTAAASYVGGAGADVIVAANTTQSFSAILGDGTNTFTSTGLTSGSVTVLGGGGVDTINVTSAAAGGGTIVIQSGGGADAVTVTLAAGTEVVNANLGEGNDTFKFGGSTSAGDSVTLDGGAGTDVLDLNGFNLSAYTSLTVSNFEVIDDSDGAGVVNATLLNGKTFEIRGTGAGSELDVVITTAGSYDFSTLVLNNTVTDANTGLEITGSAGADTIVATAGDDIIATSGGGDKITAGAGDDDITLGAGADILVFNSLTGKDSITNYSVADDSIQLSLATFTALGPVGALSAAEFVSGAAVVAGADASDRIAYNTTTGDLYYDADGSGAGAAVLIGTFAGAPVLVVGEFSIV